MHPILKAIRSSQTILAILVLVMTIFTFASSSKDYHKETQWKQGVRITSINNFYIFTEAYHTLKAKERLYRYHHQVHYDYFKYSPTFAFLMAPIALLPEFIGLLVWNYLNLFIFLLAILLMPGLGRREQLLFIVLCLLELLGSIQNEQSNGLMTGLILLFIVFMEKGKAFWAILFLSISVYVKLFSVVFFLGLLFYPNLLRNSLISVFWMSLLFILPALLTGFDYLFTSYEKWFKLLLRDHDQSIGYSVMGILQSWFHLNINKLALVVAGFLLSILPLYRRKKYKEKGFRMAFYGMLLIWVVIFNHKAESPLFIVAMAGIALWYFYSFQNKTDKTMVLLSFLFVSLVFSDLMPLYVKDNFLYKYSIKAFLPLLIWGKIIFDLSKPKIVHDTQ